jgi:hypothetical protein
VASARALVSGRPVRTQRFGDAIEFTLPRVAIHEMVCVEVSA